MSGHNSMLHKPTTRALLLIGAATMLQGCVAAVVPLAAGGLLTGSAGGSNDRSAVAPEITPSPEPTPALAAAPEEPKGTVRVGAREPQLISAPATEAETQAVELAAIAPPTAPESAADRSDTLTETNTQAVQPYEPAAATPISEPATSSVSARSTASSAGLAPTPVPPVTVPDDAGFADAYRAPGSPSDPARLSSSQAAAALASTREEAEPAPPAQALARSVVAPVEPPISRTTRTVAPETGMPSPNAVTQLLSYANQRQFISGENRTSAMLADRISLAPKRAQCGGVKPAVLIDLDPQGGTFMPTTASNPPAGLGAGLSQLRAQGVHVGWISKNPEQLSNQIRRALTRSGLDIYGRDTVLLIRKDDDRKQTLREEFSKTYCLIAIAGDDRSDFDELYDYLLDPSEASTLEPLYGEGWFLIPQPLVSEGS